MKNTIGMMTKIPNENKIKMLQFSNLVKDCNISHFITTRQGGVSEGAYASFNLGEYCGDNPNAVFQNRKILCDILNIQQGHLVTPLQVHGCKIAIIDKSFIDLPKDQKNDLLNGVDALITQEKQICIAVSTADCVPVLLYAPDKNVIASVHAGWRGTVAHIVQKTINCMITQFNCNPAFMYAGIGPSISQKSFEVGEEVLEAFFSTGINTELISIRNAKTGKPHIDLWKANELQLIDSGMKIDHIEISSVCTYLEDSDFFSARKLGINSGRMLSGIMIKE